MPVSDSLEKSFTFNSTEGPVEVDVELQLVSAEGHAFIKNANAKNDPGSMELAAVVSAVKNLRIDGQIYKFSSGKGFPKHYDEEADETLLERICRDVVRREPMLSTRYRNVFERYLDETGEEKRTNPTPSLAVTRTPDN